MRRKICRKVIICGSLFCWKLIHTAQQNFSHQGVEHTMPATWGKENTRRKKDISMYMCTVAMVTHSCSAVTSHAVHYITAHYIRMAQTHCYRLNFLRGQSCRLLYKLKIFKMCKLNIAHFNLHSAKCALENLLSLIIALHPLNTVANIFPKYIYS